MLAGQSVLQVATTGDLRDLFAPRDAPDAIMADVALRRLESSYYKSIAPQTPIAGEVDALRIFSRAKKIGNAVLPDCDRERRS